MLSFSNHLQSKYEAACHTISGNKAELAERCNDYGDDRTLSAAKGNQNRIVATGQINNEMKLFL